LEPLSRILVPVDFSPVTEPLVDLAASISSHYNSELILLHVIEEDIVEHVAGGYNVSLTVSQMIEEAKKKLKALASRAEAKGARVRVYEDIPVADPAAAIAGIASEIRASEVLIASRGWGFKRLFSLGSTSRLVVKLSPIPVLFVRSIRENDRVILLLNDNSLFGTIVYGIIEKYSEEALEYISRLAAKTKSRIVLIHVKENSSGAFLNNVERRLSYTNVEVEKVEVRGRPHSAILAYAEAVGANSIYLERKVHEGIKGLFLGSTVDRILNSSRIPVIVHPAARESR
jgi:nucleotide-binding universal stress UspA family protein